MEIDVGSVLGVFDKRFKLKKLVNQQHRETFIALWTGLLTVDLTPMVINPALHGCAACAVSVLDQVRDPGSKSSIPMNTSTKYMYIYTLFLLGPNIVKRIVTCI